MQLIARKLGPAGKHDSLRCVRDDGSETGVEMPRQGILPHDLLHALVESRLEFSDGFMGLVARGADIGFVAQEFHRYIDPGKHAQLAQAESVVEALQAQLWSGGFDALSFQNGVAGACAMRGVPEPEFRGVDLRADLFDTAVAMGDAWRCLAANATWELSFPLPASLQEQAA